MNKRIDQLTAILALTPNAIFDFVDDEVVWCDTEIKQPTNKAIQAKIKELKAQQALSEAKAEINAQTESKIFNALGVETKEKALIVQITQLSEAVAFLATKTDKRTLSETEKAEIEKQLTGFASIKKVVDDGKTAKAKL